MKRPQQAHWKVITLCQNIGTSGQHIELCLDPSLLYLFLTEECDIPNLLLEAAIALKTGNNKRAYIRWYGHEGELMRDEIKELHYGHGFWKNQATGEMISDILKHGSLSPTKRYIKYQKNRY